MPESTQKPVAMEKEINCRNFRGLFVYLRKHYGDQGIQKVLNGLVGNDRFFITDKNNPGEIIPLAENHLTDPSYWISNELSLNLLANVKKVVPGPESLFIAGEGATQESFSRNVFFLARILGPKGISKRATKVNALFNKTKKVELTKITNQTALFRLQYFPGMRVTKDVCQWNMGIYSGIAKLTGVSTVRVDETSCKVDGAPCCTIQVTWKPVPLWKRLLQWLMRAGLKDLIEDYEQALMDRNQVIDQLTLSENRYKTLTEISLQEKEKFQFLVEKSPFGVALMKENGEYLYINPIFRDIFGYTLEDIPTGRDWFDKAFPDLTYRKQVISTWKEDLQSGNLGEIRARIFKVRCKDESDKWIHFRPVSMLDGTQIITYEDITEQKGMDEQRMVMSKLESTGILAGGIAHDFNNLLAIILGNLELMDPLDQDQQELKSFLEAAKKAALEARGLTHQLITLARGGDPIKKVIFLRNLLEEQTRLTLRGTSVSFQFSIPSDLWAVEADEGQIGQVIRNIILNAREVMPDGGTISITAANLDDSSLYPLPLTAGRYVKVTISDQGLGIPEEVLDKVFDPYFSTKQRGEQKGMGLGLTICRSIIQKHGGTITVETTPGQGTSFHIYLPASSGGSSPASIPTKGVSEKYRLLVMDDEEMVRDMLKSILSRLGYEVIPVEKGEEAIADYQKAKNLGHPFDAVILDLTVRGGMGGTETLRELQKIDQRVKAIVSSGYEQDPILKNFAHHGFQAALTKPFLINEISAVLSQVLGKEGAKAF